MTDSGRTKLLALTIRTDPKAMNATIDTERSSGVPAKVLSQSIKHYPKTTRPSVVNVVLLVPPSHREGLA